MNLESRRSCMRSSKPTEKMASRTKSTSSSDLDCPMTENDIALHQEKTDSEMSQIILSVMWHGNMLGAAYYDTDTCQMHLMKDKSETAPSFRLLHILVRQVEPAWIILSSRTDERFVNVLENITRSTINSRNSESESDNTSEKIIQQLPSLDFAYEICKYRLNHIDLPSMPKGLNDTEKQIYMTSLLDFTNSCMIKAAGGLLKFIEKGRIGFQLENIDTCPVSLISTFSLEHIVTVDMNTFSALQIFQQERQYKNSIGVKEGLSLYAILNRCKSRIGSRKLKHWFLQPTNDLELIEKRQAPVKYFIELKNMHVMQSLQNCLKNINFIPAILSHMRTSQATIKDWQALYKLLYHVSIMDSDFIKYLQNLNFLDSVKSLKIFKFLEKDFYSHKLGEDTLLVGGRLYTTWIKKFGDCADIPTRIGGEGKYYFTVAYYSRWQKCIAAEGEYFEGGCVEHMILINHIRQTTYNAMVIGDICRSLHSGIEIFQKIGNAFTPDLFRIASLINKIVDFDESVLQNRFIVKPGIDDELDQRKRTYNGLPDFMTKVAQQELQQLSNDIHECSVIYLPQLGYLLAIPETEPMKVTKDYRIENLEFMFISKNVAHYKSASTRELDRLLGDTLCEITDQETEIMHKLQNVILEISQVLLDVMTYSAELDCLICLAVVAKEFNLVQPEMTRNGSMHIVKGRHLLQELCVSSFMPNDTHSSPTDSKIKIITGPNGSGKSVYLKQVGIIVFLAHIGSFVPAEKAQITLVDQIFSRIQSVESISINKSSFFIGLCQMSDILNHATDKSLVLVDEFGNRTEATAGLFLLSSIIHFWANQGLACPHIFVSTHFHRLYDFLTHSDILKFQTMEVLKTEKDLVYLFKIIDGRAEGSFGNYVAFQAGLPNSILEREREISKLLGKKGQSITSCNPKTSDDLHKRHELVREHFLQLDVKNAHISQFFNEVIKILRPQAALTTSTLLKPCAEQATTSSSSTGQTTTSSSSSKQIATSSS